MKSLIFYLLLLVSISLVSSCSSDDDVVNTISEENGDEDNDDEEEPVLVCGQDIAVFTGTTCCIDGDELVSPGETLTYTYSTNRDVTEYEWLIESGAISIVSGQDSRTVTVEIENDFTNGEISALGGGICLVFMEINKE